MIVITGAAGFIGSCLVSYFNQQGHKDLVLSDDFSHSEKENNLTNKQFLQKIDRKKLFDWIDKNHADVEYVIHIGARTDTTEFNEAIFEELNLGYTQKIWSLCTKYHIPLIYASSAATYGAGENGYNDDETKIKFLNPLNPYGWSKQKFDVWALEQKTCPPNWYGLKFFNVFGPNEYHKKRMASVVFHAFNQIKQTDSVKLFRSHHSQYKDGEQLRDFIYVKDVCQVIYFLFQNKVKNGIYNLGTGKARTFLDLTKSVFKAMDKPESIMFIDTPIDIRDKYQYYTQADMKKLQQQGYQKPFTPLESAVEDYVKNYLLPNRFF